MARRVTSELGNISERSRCCVFGTISFAPIINTVIIITIITIITVIIIRLAMTFNGKWTIKGFGEMLFLVLALMLVLLFYYFYPHTQNSSVLSKCQSTQSTFLFPGILNWHSGPRQRLSWEYQLGTNTPSVGWVALWLWTTLWNHFLFGTAGWLHLWPWATVTG